MVALESSARWLHFLHLLGGVACVAVCTHLLVRLIKSVRRGRHVDVRIRLHALLLLLAYGSTYGLGTLFYPTFRVRVRAEYLDRAYPWATGLFEIKEHAASIALLPVVAIFVLSRVLDPKSDDDRRYVLLFGGLISVVLCVVIYNACVGWYLGTLRTV